MHTHELLEALINKLGGKWWRETSSVSLRLPGTDAQGSTLHTFAHMYIHIQNEEIAELNV